MQSNSIGDGGHSKAAATQAAGEAQNARDTALRKYRDLAYNVNQLRASLDNNTANKAAEVKGILDEINYCKAVRIFTPRCQDLQAMKQSEIDDKWHALWMRDHRAWTALLDEKSKASLAYFKLTGKQPEE